MNLTINADLLGDLVDLYVELLEINRDGHPAKLAGIIHEITGGAYKDAEGYLDVGAIVTAIGEDQPNGGVSLADVVLTRSEAWHVRFVLGERFTKRNLNSPAAGVLTLNQRGAVDEITGSAKLVQAITEQIGLDD